MITGYFTRNRQKDYSHISLWYIRIVFMVVVVSKLFLKCSCFTIDSKQTFYKLVKIGIWKAFNSKMIWERLTWAATPSFQNEDHENEGSKHRDKGKTKKLWLCFKRRKYESISKEIGPIKNKDYRSKRAKDDIGGSSIKVHIG